MSRVTAYNANPVQKVANGLANVGDGGLGFSTFFVGAFGSLVAAIVNGIVIVEDAHSLTEGYLPWLVFPLMAAFVAYGEFSKQYHEGSDVYEATIIYNRLNSGHKAMARPVLDKLMELDEVDRSTLDYHDKIKVEKGISERKGMLMRLEAKERKAMISSISLDKTDTLALDSYLTDKALDTPAHVQ